MNIKKRIIKWLSDDEPTEKQQPVPEPERVIVKREVPVVAPITDDNGGTIDVHGKINDKGQIELKIDWTEDFIKQLRANGYNGANDDVIVQQYLATIHRRLMEEEKSGSYE